MTATSNPAYPGVAPWIVNESQHRRDIARTLNNALIGKLNVTLDLTVAQSVSSTTITDARIGYTTAIIPTATSSNGALLIGAGIYFNTYKSGSVVMHHSSWALPTMNLRLVLVG